MSHHLPSAKIVTDVSQDHREHLAKAVAECGATTISAEVLSHGFVTPLTRFSRRDGDSLPTFDGGANYSDGSVCNRSLHLKNGAKNCPDVVRPDASAKFLEGTHLYGGILKNEHFGHFLAESLCRLWPVRFSEFDSVVFHLRDRNRRVPSYMRKMLDLISPGLRLTIIDTPTKVEHLYVPDQAAHPIIGFIYGHPQVRAMFGAVDIAPHYHRAKIYVSRSKLTANEGEIIGESFLERELAKEGYEIVHPQELPIEEQIAIYKGAKHLVFAEGSPIHLYAPFCNPSQRAFVVRRRPMSIVFDWQVATFGGRAPAGTPCADYYLIPTREGASLMRAKAVLDFEQLRQQLVDAEMISGQDWTAPSAAEIEGCIQASRALIGEPLMRHVL